MSIGWLNRIAKALGVEAQDLVDAGDASELQVVAVLGAGGADAPRKNAIVVPPRPRMDRSPSSSPGASAIIAPATKSGATRLIRPIRLLRSIVTCSSRDLRGASCSAA